MQGSAGHRASSSTAVGQQGSASSSTAVGQQGSASSSTAVGQQERDTYSFQIGWAVPESQLQAWFDQAAAGDRVAYCRGFVPSRESAAWKLAGAWSRAGLVDLVQAREGAETLWLAQRRGSLCQPATPIFDARKTSAEAVAQLQLAALLDLLRDAAAAGLRCPSKTELAKAVTGQITLRARNRVTYLRKRLEADGHIAVAAGTHNRAPVVTILARGRAFQKSTKGES